MKAVILAGGMGTRLRPYTITIPKPLLPIGNYSALEILVRQLVRDGIQELRITLAYQASLVQAMFGDGGRWGAKIDYFVEPRPLGTAGCLAHLGDWFDQPLVVCNGDLLTNINLAQLVHEHQQRSADITIAVRPQEVKVPYGVVEFSAEGLLAEYREKPTLSYWVSTGIYVVSPTALPLIPLDQPLDMPTLHLRARDAGLRVFCVPRHDSWFDIGAVEDYDRACQAFAASPEQYLVPLKS
ncbi:MAG: sugar phosphate nucleotidyltransferase [Planctomycetota bacterium]